MKNRVQRQTQLVEGAQPGIPPRFGLTSLAGLAQTSRHGRSEFNTLALSLIASTYPNAYRYARP